MNHGFVLLYLSMVILMVATDGTAAEIAELSVPPMDHLEYPTDRPHWLEKKPDLAGQMHSIVVVSTPQETAAGAAEELQWMQRAAVATYVSTLTGSPEEADIYSITDREIEDKLIVQRYQGTLMQGDTQKYERAVELRFDPDTQDEIKAAWQNVAVARRLKALGGLASVGLVLLVCSSGMIGIVARRVPVS